MVTLPVLTTWPRARVSPSLSVSFLVRRLERLRLPGREKSLGGPSLPPSMHFRHLERTQIRQCGDARSPGWTGLSCPRGRLPQVHPCSGTGVSFADEARLCSVFPSRAAPDPGMEGWDPPGLVGCGDTGEPTLALEEGMRCTHP